MKHGEYKTPGGKLVIVDFDVTNNLIHNMQINGDFFLEPAEALSALNESLENFDATATEQELADRITAAVPQEAELIGFNPTGIAIAIRRALQ